MAIFSYLSTRDRQHFSRVHASWRSIRRLAGRSYDGPRVAAAWEEVKGLHTWPQVHKLSRAERLLLSGSVVPGETAGRPPLVQPGTLPWITAAVLLIGFLLLFGGRIGTAVGDQVGLAWSAFQESSQTPSSAPAPPEASAVVALPTATVTPPATATPLPTVSSQTGRPPATATPTQTPTVTPTPTPTATPTPVGRQVKAIIEGIIRSQPHQDAPRVGRLPVGATVTALQVVRGGAPFPPENRWIEIRLNDLHGYVYWSLLEMPEE